MRYKYNLQDLLPVDNRSSPLAFPRKHHHCKQRPRHKPQQGLNAIKFVVLTHWTLSFFPRCRTCCSAAHVLATVHCNRTCLFSSIHEDNDCMSLYCIAAAAPTSELRVGLLFPSGSLLALTEQHHPRCPVQCLTTARATTTSTGLTMRISTTSMRDRSRKL